jgi:hypothetical protein
VSPPDLANVITITALIAASFLISYLIAQHTVRQARENARAQLELRLSGLTSAIAEVEARVADLTQSVATLSAASGHDLNEAAPIAAGAGSINPAVPLPSAKPDAEIPPEILIVISAAVTQFLGKPVRIRSAKMLQSPYEIVNPWAQQGRVFLQASHSPAMRQR